MKKEESEKWIPATLAVHVIVEGVAYKDTGLGIYCDTNIGIEGLSGGRRWIVVHLWSGRAISTLDSYGRARTYCELIAPLADWNAPIRALEDNPDVPWKKIREALQAAQTWQPEVANRLYRLKQNLTLTKNLEEA